MSVKPAAGSSPILAPVLNKLLNVKIPAITANLKTQKAGLIALATGVAVALGFVAVQNADPKKSLWTQLKTKATQVKNSVAKFVSEHKTECKVAGAVVVAAGTVALLKSRGDKTGLATIARDAQLRGHTASELQGKKSLGNAKALAKAFANQAQDGLSDALTSDQTTKLKASLIKAFPGQGKEVVSGTTEALAQADKVSVSLGKAFRKGKEFVPGMDKAIAESAKVAEYLGKKFPAPKPSSDLNNIPNNPASGLRNLWNSVPRAVKIGGGVVAVVGTATGLAVRSALQGFGGGAED